MGKQRKRRFKSHVPVDSKKDSTGDIILENTSSTTNLPIEFKQDVFQGVDITALLKEDLPKADDTQSMRSYISNKSLKREKVISKKQKLKLRREMLLKKIDTVNQSKKNHRARGKNTRSKIIENKKFLPDNLPSLEPLFKLTDNANSNRMKTAKKRAVEKSKKMQKNIIQNISVYKKLLKNPSLAKNPLEAISVHLQAAVEQEKKLPKTIRCQNKM